MINSKDSMITLRRADTSTSKTFSKYPFGTKKRQTCKGFTQNDLEYLIIVLTSAKKIFKGNSNDFTYLVFYSLLKVV